MNLQGSPGKVIRLLIVDDSVFFREFLSRIFQPLKTIEVVGTAADAFEAERKLGELSPDVIALDMEMPKMRGADFLKRIYPRHSRTKAVVISAIPNNVFEALQAGAVDFVSKPNTRPGFDNDAFVKEVVSKIHIAASSTISPLLARRAAAPVASAPQADFQAPRPGMPPSGSAFPRLLVSNSKTIIAIGASTGGTEAILAVLKDLPTNIPGIVIVQHMPPVFTKMYAERLDKNCNMQVREAQNGDRVEAGVALVAAGDKQMTLKSDARGYYVKCEGTEKVSGHCPSVDVLFESVSQAAGKNAIGVILTGMGSDGAKGLLQIKKTGAYTICQDKDTCVVYGMPMVAFNIGAVKEQLPLGDISDGIMRRLTLK